MLALTAFAVHISRYLLAWKGGFFSPRWTAKGQTAQDTLEGQNDFFLSLFSRAEVVSPWDGLPSGAVLIPQAASRPRSWLATVLCKRPILVLGPTVRCPGGLRGLTGLELRWLETKSYLTRWPARGQRYLMTILSGSFWLSGWLAGWERGASALTDHLQIFEHHYFPGTKGLVGAPLIRGRSGHSHLRSAQRDGGNAVVIIGKVNR